MNFIIQTASIIFWFVVILVPLIIIHEFGHLLIARLFGVKIPEYGVGFPVTRRWFYKRWKGIIWSFYPVLIGGFVRIYGDSDAIDKAQDTAKTNHQKAKEEYVNDRISELLTNQELQFFLEDNSLAYTQEWRDLEKSKFIKGKEDPKEAGQKQHYNKLLTQLQTLADWEFDAKLDSKEAFFHKAWWQQTLIILGGITFNLLSAIFFFWIMFSFTGGVYFNEGLGNSNPFTSNLGQIGTATHENQYPSIEKVYTDTAAQKSGLKDNDQLISFAGQNVKDLKDYQAFANIVKDNKNKDVEVVYKSGGETKKSTVKLEEKDGKTIFGIGNLSYKTKYTAKDPINGIQMALSFTGTNIQLNFQGIGRILTALLPTTQDKSDLNLVAGPIATSSISQKIFNSAGFPGILLLMGVISVGLAVFNMLPIPALDGGRFVIITLNRIFGKRSRKAEAIAISLTMILLLGLSLVIAIKDVRDLASGFYN